MAAPSGIVWGDTVGGYGRIGIYVKLTNSNTVTTRLVEIWFWSKYSVSDSNNTLYYNNNATSATTSQGSKNIKTTVDSGSGWSTTNQVKIASYTAEFTRGTAAKTYWCAAKLIDVDRVGGTMTAKTSYTIPALAKYTVSYSANGGSGAPSSQTKYYGKALTLSTTKPTRTGYTFLGWSTSSTATSATWAAGGSYTTNASDTLYAVWKANTYTITYNANGGSGAPSNQNYTYASSGTITLSSTKPTKTGYTFVKWNTKSDGSGTSYNPGGTFNRYNSSTTLYAIWQINTYTVSYNANGGSGSPSSQTKTYGKDLTLSTTKPTRTGYTFQGWGTSASDTSVDYAAGGTYKANAAITLYAIWKANTYTLTLNANGGSVSQSSFTLTYNSGNYYGINAWLPVRTGYTFLGWYTSASGGTQVYNASGMCTNEGTYWKGNTCIYAGNYTLYAHWQINQYTLTVKPNGGTWNGSGTASTFTQNYNTTVSIPVPVWQGHTFTGWTLSGYGSMGTLGAAATTYTFKEGNGSLTAKWDTNDYSVLLDAYTNGGLFSDGAGVETISVEFQNKIGTLPEPVRKNYTFLGWFTSPTGGTRITGDYVVTGNVTFYAQYAIDASAYANDEGTWKPGVVFAKDTDGTMKKGHVKINDEDVWKDAFCK